PLPWTWPRTRDLPTVWPRTWAQEAWRGGPRIHPSCWLRYPGNQPRHLDYWNRTSDDWTSGLLDARPDRPIRATITQAGSGPPTSKPGFMPATLDKGRGLGQACVPWNRCRATLSSRACKM